MISLWPKCVGVLLLAALTGGRAVAAEMPDDPEHLIDRMLVEPAFTTPCPSPEKCSCGRETSRAEYRLASMGTDAFLALLRHVDDGRPSCRSSPVQGRYDNSIGAFCYDLLLRHLEGAGLAGTGGSIGLAAVPENHRVFAPLPKEMVVAWIRAHLGLSLREMQTAAARYAVELSLRDDRFGTARVWRERLKQLNATDLPEADPKERTRQGFNHTVFRYDPRTVLGLIWDNRIRMVRACFPSGGDNDDAGGTWVIGGHDRTGLKAFYAWVDRHVDDLNASVPVGVRMEPSRDAGQDGAAWTPDDSSGGIEVMVSGGVDSDGEICWDPFITLPRRAEGVDRDSFRAVFKEHGRRVPGTRGDVGPQ